MKKLLTLTNEQARLLYNLIINHTVPERSDNRKRIRFLEVLEDAVDEFSDEMRKFVGKKPNDVKEKIDKLSERMGEFTFNDREMFSKVKDMFEAVYPFGTIERDAMGKVTRSPLVGRDAKVYTELEDAFADVKDIKEKDRKKK